MSRSGLLGVRGIKFGVNTGAVAGNGNLTSLMTCQGRADLPGPSTARRRKGFAADMSTWNYSSA